MASAEQAYLFRHALLRDAAYQLQLPGDRAKLHGLALDIIEASLAAAPSAILDQSAEELAQHAKLACGDAPVNESERLLQKELHYLERAALHARAAYSPGRALKFFQSVAQHPSADARKRASMLASTVELARRQGDFEQAEVAARQALENEGSNLTPSSAAEVLNTLANILEERRRRPEAIKLIESAMSSSAFDQLPLLSAKANLLWDDKKSEEADLVFKQALALAVGRNNKLALVQNLGNYSLFQVDLGRLVEGEQLSAQALQEARARGDRHAEAVIIGNLGFISRRAGRLDLALDYHRKALELRRSVGDRAAEAMTLGNIGSLLAETGPFDSALDHTLQSIALFRESGNTKQLGKKLTTVAELYRFTGQYEAAQSALNEAAVHSGVDRQDDSEQGKLFADLGRTEDALAIARRALALAQKDEWPASIAVAHQVLGQRMLELGLLEAARSQWQSALLLHQQGGSTRLECVVKCLLAKLDLLSGKLDDAENLAAEATRGLDSPGAAVWRAEFLTPVQSRIQIARDLAQGGSGEPPPAHAGLENAAAVLRAAGFAINTPYWRRQREWQALAEFWLAQRGAGAEAQVFNGHLPAELPPRLRLALLNRAGLISDDKSVVRASPLVEEMLAGTETFEIPDWKDANA